MFSRLLPSYLQGETQIKIPRAGGVRDPAFCHILTTLIRLCMPPPSVRLTLSEPACVIATPLFRSPLRLSWALQLEPTSPPPMTTVHIT